MATNNSVNVGLAGATGTGNFVGANTPTLITPVLGAATGTSIVLSGKATANNVISGFATTVTAAGTTTLLVSSPQNQEFTGSTTQTVVMPVTSTLALGQQYYIINNSSGIVTVQSSGANTIQAMNGGSSLLLTCVLTSGTTAASWQASYLVDSAGVSSITGTANQITASASTGAVTLSMPATVRINTSILDTNSNTMLGFTPASSAVNSFGMTNSATGTAVDFKALGGDTDVGMNIWTAGAGAFQMITQAATNPITIYNGTGGQHTTTFQMANTSAGRTVVFPDATGTLLMTGQAINTVPSISFGGSALSNYLEGTFTPVVASSGGGTNTYTLQQGSYTRIGNRVLFNLFVILSNNGMAAGSVTISGLPIAAAASCACAVFAQSLAAGVTTQVMASTSNASTSIGMSQYAAGAAGDINANTLTNTSQFEISGNYIV